MNSKLIIFITSTEIYGYDITNQSDVSVISIDGDSRMKLDDGPASDFIEYIKEWYSIESFSEIDIEAAVIDCNAERTVLHELLSQLKDCISVSVYPLKLAALYALIGKNGSAADGEYVDYAGYTYRISCIGDEYSLEEAEHSDSSIMLSDSDFYFVFHMKAVSGAGEQVKIDVDKLNSQLKQSEETIASYKDETAKLSEKNKSLITENNSLIEKNKELQGKIDKFQKLLEIENKKSEEQKKLDNLKNQRMLVFADIPECIINDQMNSPTTAEIHITRLRDNEYWIKEGEKLAIYTTKIDLGMFGALNYIPIGGINK